MRAARPIGILTILNIAGALASVLTSVVIAHYFGTTRAVEVFFAASTLQALLGSLTQTGQVAEIFLPLYHRLKYAHGLKAAQEAFSVVLNWMILVVVMASGALWFFAPVFIRLLVPGFAEKDHLLGAQIFRVLVPLVSAQVAVSLVQTLSNAEGWFGKPESVTVLGRFVILVSLWALARPLGVWAIVVSLWIGQGCEVVGYVIVLWRMGYRHRLRLYHEHFRVSWVFGRLSVTLSYVAATQVYAFALNAGLSLLPQGVYAVFRYVQQLYSKTNAILLRPVSVVFFSKFSEALAEGRQDVAIIARKALIGCLVISAAVVSALAIGGKPLLGGLWGGHRFPIPQIELAAQLLSFLYLLMVPASLGLIARKAAMSLGIVARTYVAAALCQLACAGAARTLIGPLGIAGAMLTVAVNETLLAAAPVVMVSLRNRRGVLSYPWRALWRWAAASGASVLVAHYLFLAIGIGSATGRAMQFLWALCGGGSAAILTFAVAYLLDADGAREVVTTLVARMRLPARFA